MPGPPKKWVATPDKTNHTTKGYTSKVIFNYQSIDGVPIGNHNEILSGLRVEDTNYKGDNTLPPYYFSYADGRMFRITMYFLKDLDGNSVIVEQIMYDNDNDQRFIIATPTITPPTVNAGDITLVKYECDVSVYLANIGLYAQGIGNLTYANSTDGSNVIMDSIIAPGAYLSGVDYTYLIQLTNECGGDILVLSLIIEEIS